MYKKYNVNENFFSLDTPESFYWAGFIAADGCILKNLKVLEIGLGIKDKKHLKKFKSAIKYTGNISIGGKENIVESQ